MAVNHNKFSDLSKYEKHYTPENLLNKLKKVAAKAGYKVVFNVLTLFYTLCDGDLTIKEKSFIIGALGYFILPIDILPDFLVPVGYTDDLALLLYVLSKLKKAITPEIKKKAEIKIKEYNWHR